MTQQINLYNPAFLRRNPAFEPLSLLACAMVVGLFAVAGAGGYARKVQGEHARELARVEESIRAEQASTAALVAQKAARRGNAALEAEAGRLEAAADAGEQSLTYIRSGVLGSTQGFSGSMRALSRQSIDGVWLTGFSFGAGGAEMVLRGRMLDAELLPRFLARLGQDKAFAGRRFDSLSIGAAGAAEARPAHVGFEIVGQLAGPAPERK